MQNSRLAPTSRALRTTTAPTATIVPRLRSRTGSSARPSAGCEDDRLEAEPAGYDGRCPLVTGYGRLLLVEFDYDVTPAQSIY